MKVLKVLAICIFALLLVGYDLPPQIPSSFYGYVYGANVGMKVTAICEGNSVSTKTFKYENQIVYSLDVDGNHKEGAIIRFFIGSKLVGTGVYHSGTNIRKDFFYSRWFFR